MAKRFKRNTKDYNGKKTTRQIGVMAVGLVCHKHKLYYPFAHFSTTSYVGPWRRKKGKRKIVVDFVNIGKNL